MTLPICCSLGGLCYLVPIVGRRWQVSCGFSQGVRKLVRTPGSSKKKKGNYLLLFRLFGSLFVLVSVPKKNDSFLDVSSMESSYNHTHYDMFNTNTFREFLHSYDIFQRQVSNVLFLYLTLFQVRL